MTQAPLYWSLAVADIEGFGRRTDTVQQALRADLRRVITAAFAAAGVDASGFGTNDVGDGVILRIPASVPKAVVTQALTNNLHTELVRRTMEPHQVEEMRLRIALHSGEVGEDAFGIVGSDLNTACRLVDAQMLRTVLNVASRSYLAAVVSQSWYDAVVRHGYDRIDPSAYRPARLDVKELHETVWITVPGRAEPPGLPPYTPDAPEPEQVPPHGRQRAEAGARTLTVSGTQYGDSVMGDKHVGTEYHTKGGVQ